MRGMHPPLLFWSMLYFFLISELNRPTDVKRQVPECHR